MIIDNLLREAKMSRYKLSKESGVAQATISDICSGKASMDKCSAGTLYKIAKVLNVTVDSLLEAEEQSATKKAATELYGGYDKLPDASRTFMEAVYQNSDLTGLYEKIREDEKQNKDILLEFQDDYPDVLNGDNLADILKAAKAKKK